MEGQRVVFYFAIYFRKFFQFFWLIVTSLRSLILQSSWGLLVHCLRDRSCGVSDTDLYLFAPFNPAHEIPSVSRVQQVTAATEPALHGWCEDLCPAWSQSRRKAVSSQQCELKASEAGESHARFLRFYANCLRLGRSVKILMPADTLCLHLRLRIFMYMPKKWKLVNPVFHQNWNPNRNFMLLNKSFTLILKCFI